MYARDEVDDRDRAGERDAEHEGAESDDDPVERRDRGNADEVALHRADDAPADRAGD